MVTLRPLREDEYEAWDAAHRAEYEHGLVEFAGLSADAARVKVEHDIAAVLPDGLRTADTWIWAIEADGRQVGTVWLGFRGSGPWLYDITIDEAERGRGYGRGAMLALEDEVRAARPRERDAERLGRERGRPRSLPLARLRRGVGAHAQAALAGSNATTAAGRGVERDVGRLVAQAERSCRTREPREVRAQRCSSLVCPGGDGLSRPAPRRRIRTTAGVGSTNERHQSLRSGCTASATILPSGSLGVPERDAELARRAVAAIREHDEHAAQDPVRRGVEDGSNDGVGESENAQRRLRHS